MNEELMTMGLVTRSKKKGRTYRYSAYYLSRHSGKWNFYSSAIIPNTDLDTVRKRIVGREFSTWDQINDQVRIVVADESRRPLGQIERDFNGYPVWIADGKKYNLSSVTGKIAPYTKHRRA